VSDDVVNWRLLGQRLDRIQQDMGLMRLRDEQREAGYQAIAATLSRQMVEVTAALEGRLNSIDDRLDGMEDQLIAMSLTLDALSQK